MSRNQEIVATLGLIVAVIACIGGWLAVPQIQRLIEQLPSPSTQTTAVAVQPTPSSRVIAAQPPTMTIAKPTLIPPTPTLDLWDFYVSDIKSTNPNAQVTADTLKEIGHKIPSNVPFLAEPEVGLIPYQYNWRILDREGPVFLNASEGGYAYIAWGFGNVKANAFSTNFQAIEDNAYLVLVMGKPDDGTPIDLNTPLQLSSFQAGFAGTNFAVPAKGLVSANRKVVNKAWLSQQLWWASSHRLITVSIWDVSNGKRIDYDVSPSNFTWTAK